MRNAKNTVKTQRHRDALRRELGPHILQALDDPAVVEVMLNADSRLWLDHRSDGLVDSGHTMAPEQARGLIATVAGLLGRVVGEDSPILEVELPFDGSRFEALIPPVVEQPVFTIRKRASAVIPLNRYVADGIVTFTQAEALRMAMRERRNIVVSGGPGSGKTTFVNALLAEMAATAEHTERFVILEDTYELRCDASNHVVLHTADGVGLRSLVRATLRLRPDRIVVGEVRGAEAHDLLKAWNTGNPGGCATLHANSAVDALERLDQLAQEAGVPSQARLVASTVDLVAHLERCRVTADPSPDFEYPARTSSGRVLRQLMAVRGHQPAQGFLVEDLGNI